VDARKVRIDEEAAWALLKKARTVTVAKGKQFETISPADDGREAVLKRAMGPSGSLRAPTFRVGDDYVIGFNAAFYEDWVK